MIRIRNFLPLAATLSILAIAGLASPARATFEVWVYDDNALAFTATGSGLFADNFVSYSGLTTHFTLVGGSGTSNFPGDSPSTMSLNGGETIAALFGTAGGTNKITIVESEDGWLAPTGTPLALTSAGGGSTTLQSGNSVTATYQAWLDPLGPLYAGGATYTTPGGTSNPQSSETINGPVAALAFNDLPNPSVAVVPGGTPFTLTTVQTFTFTLIAGSSAANTANASDTTDVSATPAPGGLVLALSALPCLGIGLWLRRRRLQAA